jgi:hypothetical protein
MIARRASGRSTTFTTGARGARSFPGPERSEVIDMPELTRRYIVMTMATEAPFDLQDPDAPFVLKPWKDPAALRALEAYRDHAYPELASEIAAWIEAIGSGPRIRGGVGARNEAHVATRPRPRPASARPKAKPKAAKAAKKRLAKKAGKAKGKRRS